MKPDEVWPQVKANEPVPTALDPCGIGAAGADYANEYAAPAVDPRKELLYRIDYRVGQLLHQIHSLHDARRIVEHAGYETMELLRKLENGGL